MRPVKPARSGTDSSCCWHFEHPQKQSGDRPTSFRHIRRSGQFLRFCRIHIQCAPTRHNRAQGTGANAEWLEHERLAKLQDSHPRIKRSVRFLRTGWRFQKDDGQGSNTLDLAVFGPSNGDRAIHHRPHVSVQWAGHRRHVACVANQKRYRKVVRENGWSPGYSLRVHIDDKHTDAGRSRDPKHARRTE